MNKKEILAQIEHSFHQFENERKEIQQVKNLLDQCLKQYSESIARYTAEVTEAEKLFDSYMPAPGKDSTKPMEAAKPIQEVQQSFNVQYLQLQIQMQHENQVFTAVSNIMKTKHDTAKNTISNIR